MCLRCVQEVAIILKVARITLSNRYLTADEFAKLDRFEGIPETADPFCTDFNRNRYRREWVDVEVDRPDNQHLERFQIGTESRDETTATANAHANATDADGNANRSQVKIVRGLAYIRNDVTWRGFPSTRYLSACVRNLLQFWPDMGRPNALDVSEQRNMHVVSTPLRARDLTLHL